MQNINQIVQQTLQTIHQVQQSGYGFWIYLILIGILLSLIFHIHSLRHRHRKSHTQTMNIRYIQRDKIILALQINQFLVKYQQTPGPGFLPLNPIIKYGWFQSYYRKIFGLGHYYKPIYPIPKIRQFINSLATIPKTHLLIYTSLSPYILQILLNKLTIQSYFEASSSKIYCDLGNIDGQKHAIQVDQDSRRVVIITPTYNDHKYQDQKYFLVLRPKQEPNFLKNWNKKLKTFIQQNQSLDDLHEQLAQFKINYDSELSDYEM